MQGSGCVLGKHSLEVAPVEHPNLNVGMEFAQPPNLLVLTGHERLAQRRHLDEEIMVRKVEVGGERRQEASVWCRIEDEGGWFVFPGDSVEVEQFGYPSLRVVGEIDRQDRFGKPVNAVVPRLHALQEGCQLALGRCRAGVWCSHTAFRVQLDDLGVEIILDACQRKYVENALPLSQEVDDLVAAAYGNGSGAADNQVDLGHVLVEVLAQVTEDLSYEFQSDAGVQKGLDRPQLEEVPVVVAPPAAAPGRCAECRLNEVGASPVVQLPVGDADNLGGPLGVVPIDWDVCGHVRPLSARALISGRQPCEGPRRNTSTELHACDFSSD